MSEVETLAQEYLSLKETSDTLADEMTKIREQMLEAIKDSVEPGASLETPVAVITHVKGRTTRKLDKVALVKAGVTAKQLEAATVTTVGRPSVRIVWPGAGEVHDG